MKASTKAQGLQEQSWSAHALRAQPAGLEILCTKGWRVGFTSRVTVNVLVNGQYKQNVDPDFQPRVAYQASSPFAGNDSKAAYVIHYYCYD